LNRTTPASGATLDSAASYVSGWIGARGFGAATDKIDVNEYGFDAAFKWMGLSLQAEYLLGEAEAQSSGELRRAHGFYAQAGYMVIPKKLELAVRYSYLDPNRGQTNDTQTEQIGSISYYFDKHNLKLQGDVANIHKQIPASGARTDDMVYRLQAQIIF
jgi:phosphate-selective porin OprO/OprP